MARKRYSLEQMIGYLREAEILQAKGSTISSDMQTDRCNGAKPIIAGARSTVV